MKPTYRELQKYVRENGVPVSGRSKYDVLLQAIIDYTGPNYLYENLMEMPYKELLKIKRENKIKSVSRNREGIVKSILDRQYDINHEMFNIVDTLQAAGLVDQETYHSRTLSFLLDENRQVSSENTYMIKQYREMFFKTRFETADKFGLDNKVNALKYKSSEYDSGTVLYDNTLLEAYVLEDFPYIYEVNFNEQTKDRQFPYYIRVFAIVEGTQDDRIPIILESREKKFVLVESKEQLDQIKKYILDRLIKYGKEHVIATKVEIEFHTPGAGNSEIVRVAESPDENCLLKLIRNMSPQKIEKLYKKYPELQTQKYVEYHQIDTIAKYIRLQIRAYTPLGNKLNSMWEWFGYQNDKVLSIVVNNEHARVRTDLTHIDSVRYVDKFENLEDINVVHIEWDYVGKAGVIEDREVQYIIRLENGELVLEKTFKPSSITKNEEDDTCKMFFRCYKPAQVLYKLFAKDNIRSIRDDEINKIIIQAEHFVGRRIIRPIPKVATEIDHNRNYSAYEELPEYIGFPDTTLIPSKQASSPAFVIVDNIHNPPEFFVETMNYKSGKIVLPYPDFEYISKYCKVDVDYYLNAKFRHISIYDFAKKYDAQHEKEFINSAIGRTIAGGLDAHRKLQFEIKNDNELQQVINECAENKFEFILSADGLFTVYIPERPKGDYCFHSYILSYARIHLWKKWQHHKVCGFNVDALIVEGKYNEFSTEVGGWKTGPVKPYFRQMEITKVEPKECVLPEITVANRYVSVDNVLIVGPAGISKSFTEISDPVHGQIIATPRIELRDSFRQYFANTHTGQKLFQPSNDDNKFYNYLIKRVPRNYSYLVLDEVGMYTREEHDTILNRLPRGTILRYLYDPEQIHNNLTENPVDIQYFIDNGFRVEYIERTPETRARHSYDYGCKLDKIRTEGFEYVINNFHRSNDVRNTDHIITGNHKRVKELNDRYRKKFDMFPVRDKKRNYYMKQVDDPDIYWEKESMKDDIPKGYKYLPALAITPDSIQGRTITDRRLFVDCENLKRQGCLYVAMTRTPTEDLTFLYDDEPSLD